MNEFRPPLLKRSGAWPRARNQQRVWILAPPLHHAQKRSRPAAPLRHHTSRPPQSAKRPFPARLPPSSQLDSGRFFAEALSYLGLPRDRKRESPAHPTRGIRSALLFTLHQESAFAFPSAPLAKNGRRKKPTRQNSVVPRGMSGPKFLPPTNSTGTSGRFRLTQEVGQISVSKTITNAGPARLQHANEHKGPSTGNETGNRQNCNRSRANDCPGNLS